MPGLEGEIQRRIEQQMQEAERARIQNQQAAHQAKMLAEQQETSRKEVLNQQAESILETLIRAGACEELQAVQQELWGGKGTIRPFYDENYIGYTLRHLYPDIHKTTRIRYGGMVSHQGVQSDVENSKVRLSGDGVGFVSLEIAVSRATPQWQMKYAHTEDGGETEINWRVGRPQEYSHISEHVLASGRLIPGQEQATRAAIHSAIVDYGTQISYQEPSHYIMHMSLYHTALTAEQQGKQHIKSQVPFLRRIFGRK